MKDHEKPHADKDWINCDVCNRFREKIRSALKEQYTEHQIEDYISYMEIYNGIVEDNVCSYCTSRQPPRWFCSNSYTVLHPDVSKLYKKIYKSNCECQWESGIPNPSGKIHDDRKK